MTSYTWAKAVSGDWNTGTLWSTGTVPNSATADVTIDVAPILNAYTVTIASGESFTVRSLTINDTDASRSGANSTPYKAAELTLDGTLTFGPGPGIFGNSAAGGSLQTSIFTDPGASAKIVNAGTIDGFMQVQGDMLLTGTNGVYFTNDIQANGGTVTIDTKTIAEMTGNTLFDGIYQAVAPGALIRIGGTLEGLIVNITTLEGPQLNTGGWTELTFNGPNTAIDEWNGTAYVPIESTLTEIAGGGTVDVLTGRDYTTPNTLTIDHSGLSDGAGMLNLQAGTVTAAAFDINGGIVQGAATIVGPVVNNGTVSALAGTLTLAGSLTGTGIVEFDNDMQQGTIDPAGATLIVNSVSAGQTIVMNGDDTLTLAAPASFAGTISAAVGDTIILRGLTAMSALVNAGTLTVYDGTLVVDTLALTGDYAAEHFTASGSTLTLAAGAAGGPSISGAAAGQTIVAGQTILPFSGVIVADANVGQSETVTVTLSATANGTLTNPGAGSYDGTTGVYTVIGTPSEVSAALAALVFNPAAQQVAPGQTVTTGFSISDVDTGGISATDGTTTVIATSGTLLPAISGTVAGQTVDDTATISPFANVVIVDSNVGQTETVTVTLSSARNGTLGNLGGGSYDATTGVYTNTGSAAAVTTALQGLVFTPTPGEVGLGGTVTTNFTISDTDSAAANASDATTSVVATGVAGDPKTTLLFQHDSGQVASWAMNGMTIGPSGLVGPLPGSTWFAMGTGAFFKGDTSDLVFQNVDGSVAIWQVQGQNLVSGSVVNANPGSSWHIRGTGDFYHDGNTDILFQNDDGSVALWDMNGASIVNAGETLNPGPDWHIVGTGDFFGDANTDIVFQNDDGSVSVWDMNGTSVIASGIVADPGPSWYVKGTGDFYGDGKTDILLQSAGGEVAIWDVQGTDILQAGTTTNPGPTWHIQATGDFNADGKTDIVLQNDDGSVALWEMNGPTISASGVPANPGSAWHLLGNDQNMRFIYSGAANETLTAPAAAPEEFVFTGPAAGLHTIAGFSPIQDIVELNGAQFASFADVQAATTSTAGGAMIDLGTSTLLLSGVDPSKLHASNFALS